MEEKCSSETSFEFQRATCLYILEDRVLHNHRCENLKSYNWIVVYFPYKFLYRFLTSIRATCPVYLALFDSTFPKVEQLSTEQQGTSWFMMVTYCCQGSEM
jgi:hypothetical protein